MMASQCCRVCMGTAERPHYRSLFSKQSLEADLPRRLAKLCGIQIYQDDGYSGRLCRHCSDQFHSLEKNLDEFREKALESYRTYSRKRCSHSSPRTPTAAHRPPARKSSQARCLFPESRSLELCIHALYLWSIATDPIPLVESTNRDQLQQASQIGNGYSTAVVVTYNSHSTKHCLLYNVIMATKIVIVTTLLHM